MASEHTHKRYDEELNNLQNLLMEMARLCESQLYSVGKYLRHEADLASLESIEATDDRINQYHIDINQECIRLIAKRAPVAVDLRHITAGINIATDLERIGDECCKIARFLRANQIDTQTAIWKELRPAARLAKALLSRTIDLLGRNDSESAYILIKDDEELDVQYHSAIRVISSYMIEDSSNITPGIDVLMAAKALERIGDHCINIAEATIFAEEGQDIRYRAKRDIRASNK